MIEEADKEKRRALGTVPEASAERDRSFERLADAMPGVVWTAARDGTLTYANDRWYAYTGLSPAQEARQWARVVLHPEDYKRCVAEWVRALRRGSEYEIEARSRRYDGAYRWWFTRATPVTDKSGRVIAWCGVSTDIHDKKVIEEELRYKTEVLNTITDNAPSMLYMIDPEGRGTFVNPAVERLTGFKPEELIGQIVHDRLHRLYPDGRRYPVSECPLSGAIHSRELVQREDVFVRKDGSFFPVRCYARSVLRDGVVQGTVIEVQDITANKRAESELSSLNLELEQRVADRTAALEKAHVELLRDVERRQKLEDQLFQAKKMESIATLAGGIAHDFNNILNIILSYASLLPRTAGEPEKLLEGVGVIRETVKRGASLVQQLLALTRKADAKLERVQVNLLLLRLQTFLKETFPATIDVSVALHPEIPPLLADPNQLNQALVNICRNARDAMPEGGELRIASSVTAGESLRYRFEQARAEHYIHISITDNGSGMDEGVKNRVFEPFFTTKKQEQGIGLGLSVAYGIIASHEGFLDVASKPGYGTTLDVYLPLSEESAGAWLNAQGADLAALEEKPEAILFVEDEENQLRLMQAFLEGEGYRVLGARDGIEAVEIHHRHKNEIGLVVLDLGLPRLNGWEAYQRMRRADPDLKAIVATGYISPQLDSYKTEFCDVILKPYVLDEVLKKISAFAIRRAAKTTRGAFSL